MSDSSNVYQYTEDKNIVRFELPSFSKVMIISPDGERIFSSDSGKNAYVSETESGNLVTRLDWNNERMTNAAFGPNNTHVAACSFNSSFRAWSAKSGNVICSFKYTHLGRARGLAWSPNGTNLACGFSNTICVADIYKKAIIAFMAELNLEDIYSLTWSFDGTRILSGPNIRVWDLKNALENSRTWVGQDKKALTVKYDVMIKTFFIMVISVAFSPDGRLIACGTSNGEVFLLSASGVSRPVTPTDQMPNGHVFANDNGVLSLYFSPDGKRIISASRDMSICVWDVDTRTCIQVINIPESKKNDFSFCIFENNGNRFGESDYREIIMVASKINWRDNKGLLYGNNHSTCVIRKWTHVDEKYNLLKLASEAKINPNPEEHDLNKFIKLYKKKSDGETLTADEKNLYNILVKKELILLYLLSEKKTKLDADKKILSPVEQRMYDSLSKKYNFQVIMNSQLLQRNTLEYLKGEEPTEKEKKLDFQEPIAGYFPDDDKPTLAPLVGDTGCFGRMCKTRKGGRKGVRKTRRYQKNNTNNNKNKNPRRKMLKKGTMRNKK